MLTRKAAGRYKLVWLNLIPRYTNRIGYRWIFHCFLNKQWFNYNINIGMYYNKLLRRSGTVFNCKRDGSEFGDFLRELFVRVIFFHEKNLCHDLAS